MHYLIYSRKCKALNLKPMGLLEEDKDVAMWMSKIDHKLSQETLLVLVYLLCTKSMRTDPKIVQIIP